MFVAHLAAAAALSLPMPQQPQYHTPSGPVSLEPAPVVAYELASPALRDAALAGQVKATRMFKGLEIIEGAADPAALGRLLEASGAARRLLQAYDAGGRLLVVDGK